MPISFRLAACCAAFAVAVGSSAQNWTLEQCIDYAMEHNLQLQQKRLSVEQAQVDVYSSQGQLFPSLQFGTNQGMSWRPFAESYTNIDNGTLVTSTSEVNYNGTYGLQAQWTVWNGGRNHKTLERNRVKVQQSEVDTHATELSLKEQIAQYYVQILYQTEAVRVCREILESSQVQLERAQAMYEVGSMSRADLAQVQAQLSQDEYNVANASTQLDNYKLQLKKLLQIVDAETFDVAFPEIGDESVMAMLPNRASVNNAALESRPEIAYAQMAIEAADIDLNIAKRGYYPSVNLSAGINSSNTSGGLEKNFATQLKRNLSNSLGLTLSVPIFDNRQNKSAVMRARLSQQTAQLDLDSRRTELLSTIEQIWLNAYNAQKQYAAAKTNAEAMRESYRLVDEQFKVGLKDVVDLTTGKNNLIQSEQQMLQAKYTALLNQALLRFYAGENITLNP